MVTLNVNPIRPSVLYTAARYTITYQIFPSAFSVLFCYSGLSEIVQVIWAAYFLLGKPHDACGSNERVCQR